MNQSRERLSSQPKGPLESIARHTHHYATDPGSAFDVTREWYVDPDATQLIPDHFQIATWAHFEYSCYCVSFEGLPVLQGEIPRTMLSILTDSKRRNLRNAIINGEPIENIYAALASLYDSPSSLPHVWYQSFR